MKYAIFLCVAQWNKRLTVVTTSSRFLMYIHCAKNIQNLRIKTKLVLAGRADATVQYMSGFCLHTSGPETVHLALHLLQLRQARFYILQSGEYLT